jgi:amino acid adenylation domain-containing protein/thioester reductase-like protein
VRIGNKKSTGGAMVKPIAKKKIKSGKRNSQYWQDLLSDFSLTSKFWLEDLDLPHQKDLSKETKINSETIKLSINKDNKKTLYSILHAAWAILLHRYTGSDDILYGISINPPLPIRSIIHEGKSIETFVRALEKQTKNNQKNFQFFEDDKRISSRVNEWMNYLFLYPNTKLNKKISLKKELKRYPLICIIQKEKPLTIKIYYNNKKFSKKSIKNIASHYAFILKKIMDEPQNEIAHLSILTNSEKTKLNQFIKPIYHLSATNKDKCCHELFIAKAEINPNNLAVTDGINHLTYRQLNELSDQLAHYLLKKNIKTGDAVIVLMDRTPAIIVAMMSIFKIGAMYIPINPKYPDERIQYILTDCNPSTIIANNTHRIPAEYLDRIQILNDQYELLASCSDHKTLPTISSKEIAYIIYTSGTTGHPKGVMIKHESLTNLALWYQDFLSITAKDRASQFASSGFDSFFCETVPLLTAGGSIHIIDDHAKLTPTLFMPWLEKEKITICDLPTSYAKLLFNMPWPTQLNLRMVKIGGESLTEYPAQIFPFDIWNIYGPTEATVECTFMKIYSANSSAESYNNKPIPPPIGKPIANAEMYVVDQHFELVTIGNVGELLIGGTIISTGYLNRKQLTREKFIRNLYSETKNSKLYRTGDLVRWLDDGNLEFVGRVDNQIKIRGYRIELSEIENTIKKFPDIAEAVVLAKDIPNGRKTLVSYLVSNLDKMRIPYSEKCLMNVDDVRLIEVVSEDISKEGIALTGVTEKIKSGTSLRINIKLPGSSDSQWLSGRVAWQVDQRAGIEFDKTPKQVTAMNKCIEYYLATHNLMETIHKAASKRNIRKAIKAILPEYMIPSVFCILPQFPLTFNGKIDWKALPPPKDFERLLERQFVPPRTQLEKEVAQIWCDILDIKQVSVTDNFFDLGGNSLMVSELSVNILKKFNISIPIKIFIDSPFIPFIAEYIESKGKNDTFKSTIQDEIYHDAILNDDIFPIKKLGNYKQPNGILLTGASGFLGMYLLRELLKKTQSKIYCLIRKGQFESAPQRLIQTINQYDLSSEIQLSDRRIVILEADISNDSFGISPQQYQSMAEKIDTIYHCGAQVNTMASYTNLRNSNVQGTIEVIKFATKSVDKVIHYISTLSAAVKLDSDGCYSEEFPDSDAHNLVGGYPITKWVSERLLTQIKNRGLPVNIYRLGHILGQADTGITSVNNSLLYFIKGCIQLGLAPNWKENITFLPIDFASKAVVNISLYKPDKSEVYHLDHPHGIMWTDLVAWLQNYGYIINLCSHKKWREELTSISTDNALYPFLPQYLAEENPPETPSTNIEHSASVLKEINLPFTAITDQLLHIYFNYLCQTEFLPSPRKQREALQVIKTE